MICFEYPRVENFGYVAALCFTSGIVVCFSVAELNDIIQVSSRRRNIDEIYDQINGTIHDLHIQSSAIKPIDTPFHFSARMTVYLSASASPPVVIDRTTTSTTCNTCSRNCVSVRANACHSRGHPNSDLSRIILHSQMHNRPQVHTYTPHQPHTYP